MRNLTAVADPRGSCVASGLEVGTHSGVEGRGAGAAGPGVVAKASADGDSNTMGSAPPLRWSRSGPSARDVLGGMSPTSALNPTFGILGAKPREAERSAGVVHGQA